jgi:hypothetical protein
VSYHKKLYVIWSFEHGGWWASHRCGYVPTLSLAGRYTAEEALVILFGASHSHELRETAMPETEADDNAWPATTRTGMIV